MKALLLGRVEALSLGTRCLPQAVEWSYVEGISGMGRMSRRISDEVIGREEL
jgi:hypothetical protein